LGQSCFNKPRWANKQIADTKDFVVPQAILLKTAIIIAILKQLVPALRPSMVE